MLQAGGTETQMADIRHPAGGRLGMTGTISTAEAMLFLDSGSRIVDAGITLRKTAVW